MVGSATFLDDLVKTDSCSPQAATDAKRVMDEAKLSAEMLAKNNLAIVGLYKWVSA